MLWLPRRKISENVVKEALEFWGVEKGTPILNRLWDETNNHIICPREFLAAENYPAFDFPFVDLTRKRFPRANFNSRIRLRDEQAAAWAAFDKARSGILNLAPGKGKTVLSLQKVASLDCPALIVVHNTYLWEQWQERISSFLELPFGESIGRVQGPEFDWCRPITIAMIHTLSNMADKGEIPEAFRRHFGITIFDEVHHLSAPYFVKAAPLTTGLRFGLTATANRLDGMEFIYQYHLGKIFYTDLKQDLIPRIYFQYTPIQVDCRPKEKGNPPDDILDVKGEVNIPKLRSYVGQMERSNRFRADCIKEALAEGRKILALGHSKIQLQLLHEMFPGSGLVIQETPQHLRTEMVQSSQLCFAINHLGAEGLDDDMLDTLFVLTPFSSPNDLQQFMGRIQRSKPGKRTPVVVIFDDVGVGPFHGLCHKLKKTLKSWNMKFEIKNSPSGWR
jgi:superfamily II DNA or RNA helicase